MGAVYLPSYDSWTGVAAWSEGRPVAHTHTSPPLLLSLHGLTSSPLVASFSTSFFSPSRCLTFLHSFFFYLAYTLSPRFPFRLLGSVCNSTSVSLQTGVFE